jgi:hypothetical protein
MPLSTADGDRHICVGAFTIGGKAAGFYGRISRHARIDQYSQDIAVVAAKANATDAPAGISSSVKEIYEA